MFKSWLTSITFQSLILLFALDFNVSADADPVDVSDPQAS